MLLAESPCDLALGLQAEAEILLRGLDDVARGQTLDESTPEQRHRTAVETSVDLGTLPSGARLPELGKPLSRSGGDRARRT